VWGAGGQGGELDRRMEQLPVLHLSLLIYSTCTTTFLSSAGGDMLWILCRESERERGGEGERKRERERERENPTSSSGCSWPDHLLPMCFSAGRASHTRTVHTHTVRTHHGRVPFWKDMARWSAARTRDISFFNVYETPAALKKIKIIII